MTWQDVDFKNSTIVINKQWGFGELKSKNSYRTIPIPSATLLELEKIKSSSPINTNHRLIQAKSTRSVNINLDKHLQRNVGISVHELRHTYANI